MLFLYTVLYAIQLFRDCNALILVALSSQIIVVVVLFCFFLFFFFCFFVIIFIYFFFNYRLSTIQTFRVIMVLIVMRTFIVQKNVGTVSAL